MHLEEYENKIAGMNNRELLNHLFEIQIFKREVKCLGGCNTFMSLVTASKYIDGFAWRCSKPGCINYTKRVSVRVDSHFSSFGISMKTLLKVLLRYSAGQQQSLIVSTIKISNPTYKKLISKVVKLMDENNKQQLKLGGPGKVVQIDETMMNYKCKSHRGRSALNRTDALCIVEVENNKISKVWAQVIEDKTIATIMPIICERVYAGSIIHTDEHKTYKALPRFGFLHDCVCHKYEFINAVSRVHTQNVESFNNCLKYQIKIRKGVRTIDRSEFLSEVTWMWNNKDCRFKKILDLIKV